MALQTFLPQRYVETQIKVNFRLHRLFRVLADNEIFSCDFLRLIVITYIVDSMKSAVQSELKQSKPFASLAEEAGVALARTADEFNDRIAAFLKPYGISPTQYNVLRILRGAGTQGRMCSEIGDRMVTRDPDVTRLLDRLEKAGWIDRERDTKDRRVVITRITRAGIDLVNQIDEPLDSFNRKEFGRLGNKKLRELIALLDELRHSEAAD